MALALALALSVSLLSGFSAHASDAPIPYEWGVYKPSALGGNKIIIVDWFSAEGKKRLARSGYNTDFYQLAHAYQPQINPVYATVATAVVILNAMRLPQHSLPSLDSAEMKKPKALGGGILPFPSYTQSDFLNDKTDAIKDRKLVRLENITAQNEDDKAAFKPGLGLIDLQKILETVYHAKAVTSLADAEVGKGVEAFRKVVKKILKDDSSFLLCNFKGDLLGASTEGTVSPLAAYDEKSDSVLVLDVTGHKNPWYWVPLKPFYESMHTQYDGTWRGYMVVSEAK
jgi:hypothetical protein